MSLPPSYSWAPDDVTRMPGTFGGVEPVARIEPGSVLVSRTVDCFGGAIRSAADLPSGLPPDRVSNPLTGPFHVEGAEPGDTLAVHVAELVPRGQGVSCTFPAFGALTGTFVSPSLDEPVAERVWIYRFDLDTWTTRFAAADSDATVDLPLDPMLGTLGVAPPLGEVRSSLTPGEWGGNLDSPRLRAGTTVYLGVNEPGALLSFGDGHARQGEGETCGTGIECALDVVLVVELVKSSTTPWPRFETDDELFTTGSTKPLEDAFRVAQHGLVTWVAELSGLSELDAYQLVSQTGSSPVANVVDTNYTMLAGVPKSVLAQLGAAAAFGDVHARLRAAASSWLEER